MDLKTIACLYHTADVLAFKEFNPRNTKDDKRFVFVIKFSDNRELAIKACRNAFTTPEKISGWKLLCRRYVDLGIYCPQIVDSLNGRTSEVILYENEEYILYAEEVKRHKTYEEFNPRPDFEHIKKAVVESIGLVAANCIDPLPFPSVFCIYDTFDTTDTVDENYQNAENFCQTAKKHFQEHAAYIDRIWALFLQNRIDFEPIHRLLPKASFQSDLNPSNILVDDDMNFAGYIDFNLAGTEAVLSYIIISEVCGYRLTPNDLERLIDPDFLKQCDEYLYEYLNLVQKNYKFSDYEKENLCLCYNTVYPFSCWSVNNLLRHTVKEHAVQYIKPILDWTYHQLSRKDIKLPVFPPV